MPAPGEGGGCPFLIYWWYSFNTVSITLGSIALGLRPLQYTHGHPLLCEAQEAVSIRV